MYNTIVIAYIGTYICMHFIKIHISEPGGKVKKKQCKCVLYVCVHEQLILIENSLKVYCKKKKTACSTKTIPSY